MVVNATPSTDPLPITHKFFSICQQLTSTDSRQELGLVCYERTVKVMVRFYYNLLIPPDKHGSDTAICDTRFIIFILSPLFMAVLYYLTFLPLLGVARTLSLTVWLNLNYFKFTELFL